MSATAFYALAPIAIGAAMLLLTFSTRRGQSADAAFEDIKDMYDRVKVERDDIREKYARGEITIAQLREQLAVCSHKQAALRSLALSRGVPKEEMP